MTPEEREINREVDRLVELEKEDLEKTFLNKHKELERMNALMLLTISSCREQGLVSHADLWSLALYVNIAAFDISISVKNIALQRDYWERRLSARTSAILLYEATEDMTQLLGQPVRKCLTDLGVLSRFHEELKSVQKPLNNFWKTHQSELKRLRVSSYGHRETDGYKLLQIIDSIDSHKIMRLALELSRIVNEIGQVLQKMITYTATLRKTD